MSKKNWNWLVTVLLNYVTMGIYSMVMWFCMNKNNNIMAEKYGIKKVPSFILNVVLTIVTCGIYNIFWLYFFMKQQAAIAEASGVNVAPAKNAFVLTLLSFVPFYSFYMICDNYNRTVNAN